MTRPDWELIHLLNWNAKTIVTADQLFDSLVGKLSRSRKAMLIDCREDYRERVKYLEELLELNGIAIREFHDETTLDK